MIDLIEPFNNSLIQHGHHNDRVYLMKLAEEDLPELIPSLQEFASSAGYGKIFAKVPDSQKVDFLQAGFQQEGLLPAAEAAAEDLHFLGYYLAGARARESRQEVVDDVIALARQKAGTRAPVAIPSGLTCRVAGQSDVVSMAALYRIVFASYPFPILDPAYLSRTMDDNVVYFGVWEGERLLALASAEMDRAAGHAEMTDFATHPDNRGQGLAQHLLQTMEQEMKQRGILNLFTIARAYSHGMNITFAKNGYAYSGTLTNNTNISGQLESMNIWHKHLC